MPRFRFALLCLAALLLLPVYTSVSAAGLNNAQLAAQNTTTSSTDTAPIYWGALIDGENYGLMDPPWDMRSVEMFEANVGKKVSLLHIGFPWFDSVGWPHNKYYPFVPSLFETLHQRDITPLVTWAPWDGAIASNSTKQPNFALSTIIRGDHDAFITKWATGARDWKHPFFLRFAWEMNGDWYSWSEGRNGNTIGQYVQAWQHVHDIFTQVGATNVTWVWCVSAEYPGSKSLESLYPGDAYVDWVGIDGYNFPRKAGWQSFAAVFGPTYDHLQRLAPTKPVMIAEFGSSESGGSKADWITDALATQLPQNFPNIKAVVWFNWNLEGEKWVLESSQAATNAFAGAINSARYASPSEVQVSSAGKLVPLVARPNSAQGGLN